MRTYHHSVRIGRGKTTFPTVSLGSLRGSLAFFWKGRGVHSPWLAISQTYLSALFSCQRAVAKACCFHVKAGAEQERGDWTNHALRTVPVARYLTNVSVCFIQLSKSCGESVLLSCKSRCRAGKRGLNKSCSAVTACYSSSISKAISNPKIILISASRISPFNSISTTI